MDSHIQHTDESTQEMQLEDESYIQVRENYIKALEQTVEILRRENARFTRNNLAIRDSIDELVAMHQLSNVVSISSDPEEIVKTLVELSGKILPVIDANIFLFHNECLQVQPLTATGSERLKSAVHRQYESGVIDWVLSERRTIIIPDFEYTVGGAVQRNFVIVPLFIRDKTLGIYVINTNKAHEDFSNQDLQLLTVLANQAAIGLAHWQAGQQLRSVHEELKTSQAQLIQATKLAAIGELAAGILHEIKNPLQIIMMHLDMVRKGRAMENWLDLVSQQIRRLIEITKRLMSFSRTVSEDIPISAVNVNKAVEDILALVVYDFEREHIVIEKSLHEPPLFARGNMSFLQQVILNLLLNARDSISGRGSVTVSTFEENGFVAISVRDTGAGIPEEHLSHIFKPFFTTKNQENGTGLGLSISNKIVAYFGGKLTVESTVGKGSVFTILLPREEPST